MTAALPTELHDKFVGKGTMALPAQADSGHDYITAYTNGAVQVEQEPTIIAGKETKRSTNVGASYVHALMPGKVTRLSARFGFDPGAGSNTGAVGLLAFRRRLDVAGPSPETGCHLAILPTGILYTVIDPARGGVVPSGGSVTFPQPLAADGQTVHEATVDLDLYNSTAVVRVSNGTVALISDPRIATLAGEYATFEVVTNNVNDPKGWFTEWWASSRRLDRVATAAERTKTLLRRGIPREQVAAILGLTTAQVAQIELSPSSQASQAIRTIGEGVGELWRPIRNHGGQIAAGGGAGLYLTHPFGLSVGAGTAAGLCAFRLDPDQLAVAGKTPKLRILAEIVTNDSVPTITLTYGLHQITAFSGAANNNNLTANATPVTGSTAVITNPPVDALTQVVGSAIDIPAAGSYALGINTSAVMTSPATAAVRVILQLAHV